MGKRSHGGSSLAKKLPKKLMPFITWCKKNSFEAHLSRQERVMVIKCTLWALNGYVEEEFWNGVRWCQKVNSGNAHKQTRKSAPTPSFFGTAKGEPVNRSFLRHLSNVRKSCILPMVVATGCLEMKPKRSQEKHLTNRFHQLTLAENKTHWLIDLIATWSLSQLLPWLADELHFGWLVPEFGDAFAAVYLIKFCHYGWKCWK